MTPAPFASVEALPPTPPKEKTLNDTLDSFIQYLDTDPLLLPENNLNFLHTPPPSSSPLSKSALHKKIRFVAEPTFSDELDPHETTYDRPIPLRAIPPSNTQKSRRSILKRVSSDDAQSALLLSSQDDDAASAEDTPSKPTTPITMLESALKHLQSDDYPSRLDAYITLNRTFKAYKNEPNRQAFVAQLPHFESFLKRDLSAVSPVTKGPDTKIISQALKLIANIFIDQSLYKRLSHDFVNLLYDTFIQSLDNPHVPKEIMKHQLYMFTVERFLSRGINNSRAVKILDYLSTVHDRVSGKGVQVLRLQIIQKFYTYASHALVTRPNTWITCLMQAMATEYLRDLAVHTAALCSNAFGRVKNVTSALKSYFDATAENGRSNFENLYTDLIARIDARQDILYIPRLCAVVIMFMRGPQNRIEEWSHLTDWLRLFQVCLNHSDAELSIQAITAWNYMIFASSPSKATSRKLLHALPQPFVHIMRRRAAKESKEFELRTAALGTYCYLLNNAFRPPNSPEQFDLFWSQYVVDVLANVRIHYESDLEIISRIFSSMMRKSQLSVWDLNRYETTFEHAVTPEEIPRLDSTLIRRNSASALRIIEHLASCQKNLATDVDYTCILIEDFLWAVGEAAKRDIKTSPDVKQLLANMLNTCQRLSQNPSTARRHANPVRMLMRITKSARTHLGKAILKEKLITRQSDGKFDVVSSPSKTPLQSASAAHPWPVILLEIISGFHQETSLDVETSGELKLLMLDALDTLTTLKEKVQYLRRLTRRGDKNSACPSWLWLSAASVTQELLSKLQDANDVREAHHYVLRILQAGLQKGTEELFEPFRTLTGAWIRNTKSAAGDAAVVLTIMSPVTEVLSRSDFDEIFHCALGCATAMLEAPVSTPTDKMIEAAQRLLGNGEVVTNDFAQAWCASFSTLINKILSLVFKEPVAEGGQIDGLIQALRDQSDTSAIFSRREFLDACSEGLCAFAKFAGASGHQELFPAAWKRVLMQLNRVTSQDRPLLSGYEQFLIAGLTSNSIDIATATIDWWNTTYDKITDVSFSETLNRTLYNVSQVAHIDSRSLQHPQPKREEWHLSEQDLLERLPWSKHSASRQVNAARSLTQSAAPSPVQFPRIPHRTITSSLSSPIRSSRLSAPSKRQLPAKLRHDDSQVDFVPIDSSPVQQDSQMLTEHQKEVRSRQAEDAAMLSRFQSSPVPERISRLSVDRPTSLSNKSLTPGHHALDPTRESRVEDSVYDPYEIPDSPTRRPDETSGDVVTSIESDGSERSVPSKGTKAAHAYLNSHDSITRHAPQTDDLVQTPFDRPFELAAGAAQDETRDNDDDHASTTVQAALNITKPPQTDTLNEKDTTTKPSFDDGTTMTEISAVKKESSPSEPTEMATATQSFAASEDKDTPAQPLQEPKLIEASNEDPAVEMPTRKSRRQSSRGEQSRKILSPKDQLQMPTSPTVSQKRPSNESESRATKRKRTFEPAEADQVTSAPATSTSELVLGLEESTTKFKELYNTIKRKLREDKNRSLERRTSKRLGAKRASKAADTQESATSTQRHNSQKRAESQGTPTTQSPQPGISTGSQRSSRRSGGSQQLLTLDDLPSTTRKRKARGSDLAPPSRSAGPVASGSNSKTTRRTPTHVHDLEESETDPSTSQLPQDDEETRQSHDLAERVAEVEETQARPSKRSKTPQTSQKNASPRAKKEKSTTRERTPRPASPSLGDALAQPQAQPAAPSTPTHQTQGAEPHTPRTPPSSQTFTLSLSQRAQRVIQTLQDAYVAAQQLIWPRSASVGDAIEDLQFDLQQELRRARKRKELKDLEGEKQDEKESEKQDE